MALKELIRPHPPEAAPFERTSLLPGMPLVAGAVLEEEDMIDRPPVAGDAHRPTNSVRLPESSPTVLTCLHRDDPKSALNTANRS
uniref:Uncharacterized protein n=1 Tax=Leersia perrieri TaxID=77586 RepID=A0A0D9VCF7_9ORYZ